MAPRRRNKAKANASVSATDDGTTIISSESAAASLPDGAFEISESERMRIIEQSGILSQIPLSKASPSDRRQHPSGAPLLSFVDDEMAEKPGLDEEDAAVAEEDTLPEWVDRACDTLLYLIPFTSLFITMDILVHKQYAQALTFGQSLSRLLNFFPGLLFLIHYTLHRPSHLFTRLLFFSLSTLGGSWMVWLINRESYIYIIGRCPALGTLWVYAVVRMDLLDAVISLLLVGGFTWYKNLKLVF